MGRVRPRPVVREVNIEEKKPDVTGRKLVNQGYRYKMKELTKEQRKEQREGVKETDPKTGKVSTFSPPDYNYYYKVVDGATVTIYKVGDKFYYKNTWFRYMADLPKIEDYARRNKVYDELQKKVVDTAPAPGIENLPAGATYIKLQGGPMDGKRVAWKTVFPMYMGQYTDEGTGKIASARYRKSEHDPLIYEHYDTILPKC